MKATRLPDGSTVFEGTPEEIRAAMAPLTPLVGERVELAGCTWCAAGKCLVHPPITLAPLLPAATCQWCLAGNCNLHGRATWPTGRHDEAWAPSVRIELNSILCERMPDPQEFCARVTSSMKTALVSA